MRRPVIAVLTSAVVLAGCTTTVGGVARPVDSAQALLPTEDEITAAVGNRLSTFGFKPFVGGVDILPDGYRTEADASPIECVAVTDSAPRMVYEAVAVLEAARQSYFTLADGAAVSGADAVVVRVATADAARHDYEAFTQQWRDCDRNTVDKQLRGANNVQMIAAISDVTVAGPVVSATVVTRLPPVLTESRYERALGVEGDVIAEVSLAVTPAGERRPDTREKAVRAVEGMLDKVSTGR